MSQRQLDRGSFEVYQNNGVVPVAWAFRKQNSQYECWLWQTEGFQPIGKMGRLTQLSFVRIAPDAPADLPETEGPQAVADWFAGWHGATYGKPAGVITTAVHTVAVFP